MTMATEQLAKQLGDKLLQREWKLVTAESCTAGGLAYAVTMIPGSSAWLERGYITYSNLAKEECFGVDSQTLIRWGAVSEATAREMAEGALKHSQAQVSIAITGIAGPEGGTPDKPVGTVWFAMSGINLETHCFVSVFKGDRSAVREQAIRLALEKLIEYLSTL